MPAASAMALGALADARVLGAVGEAVVRVCELGVSRLCDGVQEREENEDDYEMNSTLCRFHAGEWAKWLAKCWVGHDWVGERFRGMINLTRHSTHGDLQ